ncbi:uncharacterized protein N0V89_004451 [Didymosphaeria variabile]|uniref:Uncharacterized protein n=1 Tax=Didymosphaeria variabile TaxID=1932322 RepID=A0A9W8XS70_9PLEO|nr:uncharacterized protein N0V89_004451 [Didymosphaeria variabile]KAJ4356418.1 hypothetical protein N0V89_004451 [Didymosphaeria variabile]
MASPYETQKKRPPPIEIPQSYPQRQIPGPNAFAIAERAAAEEQRRRAEGGQQLPVSYSSRPGHGGEQQWGASAADGPSSLVVSCSNSTASKLSTKGNHSNLVDHVRKSPRKSASVTSRYESTTQSKYNERSYPSFTSTQRQFLGLPEEATSRAEIEAQKERKLFKLMGQVPDTPTDGTAPALDNYVSINDLRPGRISQVSKHSEQEIVTRSPKKKIFGVSIPFSSRPVVSTGPTPPMPLKAARLMGTSPSGKNRKFSPLARMAAGVSVPRSDTSKSLPSKLFNQPVRHGRRRSPVQLSPRGRTGRRPSPPKSPAKATVFSHEQTLEALTGSGEVEAPPIPPRKDSLPPHIRQLFPDLDRKIEALKAMENKSPPRTVSQLLRPPTPETEPEDFHDSGMKLFLPSVLEIDPIPSKGGGSPSKYCPPGTADKPGFVEGEPLFSAHGVIAYTTEEDEPSHSAPLKSPDNTPLSAVRAEHRSAPATPITATTAWLHRRAPQADGAPPDQRSPKLEYLLPTVYSPPKPAVRKSEAQQTEDPFQPTDRPRSDTHTLCSERGSIPIVFQGDVSEIDPHSATARSVSHAASASPVLAPKTYGDVSRPDPAARIMEELRIKPRTDGPATAPTHGILQPEHSSSRLTDMLNGMSPSRADFHGYDSSSAVPSPLHRTPQATQGAMGPQQPATNVFISNTGRTPSAFPTAPVPPPPRAGIPLHDHFFMTNEHIDVVAMSIYDWVSNCNDQASKSASSKHEQLRTTIEQRFDDIKSQINSVGEKADHNGNQSHNLSVQLDKLRDFIKAEVVEPLTAQTAKMNAMDHGIKELHKAVQDLQSQSQASTATFPSPHQSKESFVNSRSQPSFPPFYDANGPGNGPIPPVPSGPPGFGRFGNNTQLGRTAYGRESRENSSYAFPNTGNPYHSAGTPFINAYGGGGYQQPMNNYPSVHDQQAYGYNQSLPK